MSPIDAHQYSNLLQPMVKLQSSYPSSSSGSLVTTTTTTTTTTNQIVEHLSSTDVVREFVESAPVHGILTRVSWFLAKLHRRDLGTTGTHESLFGVGLSRHNIGVSSSSSSSYYTTAIVLCLLLKTSCSLVGTKWHSVIDCRYGLGVCHHGLSITTGHDKSSGKTSRMDL
jgi:hypothetical protein